MLHRFRQAGVDMDLYRGDSETRRKDKNKQNQNRRAPRQPRENWADAARPEIAEVKDSGAGIPAEVYTWE